MIGKEGGEKTRAEGRIRRKGMPKNYQGKSDGKKSKKEGGGRKGKGEGWDKQEKWELYRKKQRKQGKKKGDQMPFEFKGWEGNRM